MNEARQRRAEGRASHIVTLRSGFDAIDASCKRLRVHDHGVASFANHASSRDGANARLKWEGDVVYLVAKQDIAKGAEVFLDYGHGFWRSL